MDAPENPYKSPQHSSRPEIERGGISLAWLVLSVHLVLLFGFGLMLNDFGGYLYCRLVIPSPYDASCWLFTIAMPVVIGMLGHTDHQQRGKSLRVSYYPIPVFLISQLIIYYMAMVATRS